MSSQGRVCVVTGAGPGNGRAFAAKFAAEGYRVAMLARREGPLQELADAIEGAHAYAVDVTDAQALKQTLSQIRTDLGPVSILVHNAGSAVIKPFMDLSVADLSGAFATNTQALLVAGQIVAEDMLAAGAGCIVVIGATASTRGGVATGAFAAAKAGQRSLAQTMAKSLGPQGIHVCHVIIDGVIDIPRTREMLPDKPDEFFLRADRIADAVYGLCEQDRSAWTFELDLRPFAESW